MTPVVVPLDMLKANRRLNVRIPIELSGVRPRRWVAGDGTAIALRFATAGMLSATSEIPRSPMQKLDQNGYGQTPYPRRLAWQSAKRTHLQRFWAFPPRSRFGCFPKTVSSTRRQYAATTFGSSDVNPLVTRISGPNSESVAVRLTIM